jgi:hypothetical protein
MADCERLGYVVDTITEGTTEGGLPMLAAQTRDRAWFVLDPETGEPLKHRLWERLDTLPLVTGCVRAQRGRSAEPPKRRTALRAVGCE